MEFTVEKDDQSESVYNCKSKLQTCPYPSNIRSAAKSKYAMPTPPTTKQSYETVLCFSKSAKYYYEVCATA